MSHDEYVDPQMEGATNMVRSQRSGSLSEEDGDGVGMLGVLFLLSLRLSHFPMFERELISRA